MTTGTYPVSMQEESRLPSNLTANEEIRVVAAVIRSGDRFLLCQRPRHKRHGSLWEFPGGKCETGETDYQALRRELREELAVEVVHMGVALFDYRDEGSWFRIVFIPVDIAGEPVALDHDSIRWSTLTEAGELNLAPTDLRFTQFLARAGSESDSAMAARASS